MKKLLCIISLPFMAFAVNMELPKDRLILKKIGLDQEHKNLSLSIVTSDGSAVFLTDGREYKIYPKHRIVSSDWILTSSKVDVRMANIDPNNQLSDPLLQDYPIIITNTVTGTSVRAQLVDDESNQKSKTPAESAMSGS